MLGKSGHAAAIIILVVVIVLFAALAVPEAAFAQAFPAILLEVKPQSQTIQAGGSATYNVTLYPQGSWYTWNVTLSLLNPPKGVTATFSPKNPGMDRNNSYTSVMTVYVAADAPQGNNKTLAIHWNGTISRISLESNKLLYRFDLNSTTNATLNIVAPTISTATLSTTRYTTTITSTPGQQTTGYVVTTFAWAIGAIVIAVLAAVLVLLIRGATSRSYLSFSKLFRLASLVFIVTILFYRSSLTCGSRQPDSASFYTLFYSMLGLSVFLSAVGIIDFAKHSPPQQQQRRPFDLRTAVMVNISLVVGVALTFLSASILSSYPTSVGFPLPFYQTTIYPFGQSVTSKSPLALLADCIFWVSLVYPVVWFAKSVSSGRLKEEVGRLEGVGVSAFLTYGSIPFMWFIFGNSIVSSTIGPIISYWAYYSPVFTMATVFLPSAVVGIMLTKKGYKKLGVTVALASLILIGLIFPISALAQMLGPVICPP